METILHPKKVRESTTLVRKTKEEALETKNAILNAALDVFLEKGVASASLEQIAERAGVTRGAVYWHFKNKRSIFESLHEKLYAPFLLKAVEDAESDHPYPLEQLKEFCHQKIDALKNDPQKIRMLKVFHIKCDYSGEMAEFLIEQEKKKESCITLFNNYFERAQQKGQLSKATTTEIYSLSFYTFLSGISMQFLLNPNMLNLKDNADEVIELYFSSLPKA